MEGNAGRIRASSIVDNPNIPGLLNTDAPFMRGSYAKNGYRVEERNPFEVDQRVLCQNIQLKCSSIDDLEQSGISQLAMKMVIFILKNGFNDTLYITSYDKVIRQYEKSSKGVELADLHSAIDYLKSRKLIKHYKDDDINVLIPSTKLNRILITTCES